jgi:hypothetical protein
MELETSYASRKAANGSMGDALRAGTYAARIEIAATARASIMKVAGSFGRIAYTIVFVRRTTVNVSPNLIMVLNKSIKLAAEPYPRL